MRWNLYINKERYMKKLTSLYLSSTILLLSLASTAHAQTTPPFVALSQRVDTLAQQIQNGAGNGGKPGGTTGQVLTKKSSTDYDTQWTTLGTAAQATLGTSGAALGLLNTPNTWSAVQTFTAPLFTTPSTSTAAGFNIPLGVVPTSPNNGDLFNASGLKFYDGNAVHSLAFTDGNITGSAAKLSNARTLSASGDISWSALFDGSANVTGTATLATVNSNVGTFGSSTAIPVITVDAKGRITSVGTSAIASSGGSGGSSTFTGLSDISGLNKAANATQFFGIITNSSNAISSLQYTTATTSTAGSANGGNLVQLGSGGLLDPSFFPTSISSNTTGSAAKLTTGRTIATTGDVTTSFTFDGSANVSAASTLVSVNSNTGTFGSASQVPVITTDAKGRITAISTVAVNGASGSSTFTGLTDVSSLNKPASSSLLFGYNTNSSGSITSLQNLTLSTTSSGNASAGNVPVLGSSGTLDASLLATSGATAGTYGSATASPVITVDAKGRVTSVTTAAISGGSGSSTSTDIQVFNYTGNSQTWTKPSGAKSVYIWAIAGGNGGDGGGANNSGGGNGGGGGAGGGVNESTVPASVLPATVTITVGAGGSGGTPVNNATYGNYGTAGGASIFGSYLTAFGNAVGQTSSTYNVRVGGNVGGYSLSAAGGGGSGGASSSSGYGNGGANGGQGSFKRGVTSAAGTGGSAPSGNGLAGNAGSNATSDIASNETNGGSGGGGGSGSANSPGSGNGGNGSTPGGGGGGGGGGYSAAGGTGGAGAPGRIVVITTF
jgi:hypothetical protein